MKIEIRSANEMYISGYVNAVERDSRTLPAQMARSATGPFVEKVKAHAFERAIYRNPDVGFMFNHERSLGSVKDGSLKLTEDAIGLRAEAVVTDEEVITLARSGELRGWSFGFTNAQDEWEPVSDGLQRRTLNDFDLNEVSILSKTPAYIGTSVEMRGEDCSVKETRGNEDAPEITETLTPVCVEYKTQIEILKTKGELL